MIYVTSTFSPMMLHRDSEARVYQISLVEAKERLAKSKGFYSVVSHEVTASILSALLGTTVQFNRINLEVIAGTIICIVPNFRADVAREFTLEEAATAGYKCFLITITKRG